MAFQYKIESYKNDISYINVTNGNKLEVELCNFGAGMRLIHFDGEPILLEPSRNDFPYLPDYYGKTLCRVAGRIKCHGVLNGKEYNLAETKSDYCLHGGDINSQSYKIWSYKIKEFVKKLQVIFTIKSKAKELGFPGNLRMQVIYEIYENNVIKIIYKGSTSSATLLSMSNHNYYNFFNSYNLSDYKLKINASQVSMVDDSLFIIGTKNVDEFYDFRKFHKLSSKLNHFEKTSIGTIDFTYIFDNIIKTKPQIEIKNDKLKMSVYTDYPSANIYVDNALKNINYNNELNNYANYYSNPGSWNAGLNIGFLLFNEWFIER